MEREQALCAGDEQTGLRILRRALEEPARQIARNSGADEGVLAEATLTEIEEKEPGARPSAPEFD